MITRIKFAGINFWGDAIYSTQKGTHIVKLDEGFYTLSDNDDWDSDPCRRLKDDCIKVVDDF